MRLSADKARKQAPPLATRFTHGHAHDNGKICRAGAAREDGLNARFGAIAREKFPAAGLATPIRRASPDDVSADETADALKRRAPGFIILAELITAR